MKLLISVLHFVALISFLGCSSQERIVLNEPVGPARVHPTHSLTDKGQLIVYSALEVMNTVDSDHPAHSSYTIYDHDGKILRHVDNRTGSFYQDPVSVSLPAGSYQIAAKATNSGEVLVPVQIEEGKSTIVDLDGSSLSQNKPQPGDQWVRLPGGQVIGHRAQ